MGAAGEILPQVVDQLASAEVGSFFVQACA
jgi:hypothetical protein